MVAVAVTAMDMAKETRLAVEVPMVAMVLLVLVMVDLVKDQQLMDLALLLMPYILVVALADAAVI